MFTPLLACYFLYWAHTRVEGEIPLSFCTWHESCGMRALFVARSCAGKWQLSSIGTRAVPRSTGVGFRPNTGPDGLKHTASFGLAASRPVFRICIGSSYHADGRQAKEVAIGIKKNIRQPRQPRQTPPKKNKGVAGCCPRCR